MKVNSKRYPQNIRSLFCSVGTNIFCLAEVVSIRAEFELLQTDQI